MKIAISIGHFALGGVGTSTYILASGMRKAGHQADILATDGQLGEGYHEAQTKGWSVEAICLGERWLKRRLNIVLNRLSEYDVVINNHSMETKLLLPALPSRTVRLSVIRSTDDPVIEDAHYNNQYLDTLVGISPQVTQLLQESKVFCDVRTIPNAVLVENERPPSLSNPLSIVFVGRLEERQKNILILPEIAERLRLRGVEFRLTIVGDGPHRRDIEEKIARMNLGNIIDLRGAMNRDSAWEVYRSVHFSLIPSTFEGFGLVLAESMAAGAVPIVSDIPVFRWILGEDADTLLVPVKDARAYADRLLALAADPERYRQIQQRLQQRQQENFSPASTVDGYLRLIEELLQTHDPARFPSIPLAKIPLSTYHWRRCSRAWWLLQKVKYGLRKPARGCQ
jgi:glycosyltransferase involved in cell wall biosynthesis